MTERRCLSCSFFRPESDSGRNGRCAMQRNGTRWVWSTDLACGKWEQQRVEIAPVAAEAASRPVQVGGVYRASADVRVFSVPRICVTCSTFAYRKPRIGPQAGWVSICSKGGNVPQQATCPRWQATSAIVLAERARDGLEIPAELVEQLRVEHPWVFEGPSVAPQTTEELVRVVVQSHDYERAKPQSQKPLRAVPRRKIEL